MEQQPQKVYNNCRIFESGSINIEHIEHFHQAEGVKPASQLPAALSSPKAQALLQKAQEANWLDDNFRPTCSKTMAAILASEIAEKLKLYPKWKPFEELWEEENLSRIYSKAMDQTGTNARIDDIRKALK